SSTGSSRPGADTSGWRSEARPSARCLPTRSAPMDTARMRRPPLTCSCGCRGMAHPGPEGPGLHRRWCETPALWKEMRLMATYRILYWQEVPSQVRAEDDAGDEVTVALPQKFMVRIDALA